MTGVSVKFHGKNVPPPPRRGSEASAGVSSSLQMGVDAYHGRWVPRAAWG